MPQRPLLRRQRQIALHQAQIESRPPGLFERGVVVRDIPGRNLIRASCGWWTSEADIERLLAGLEA